MTRRRGPLRSFLLLALLAWAAGARAQAPAVEAGGDAAAAARKGDKSARVAMVSTLAFPGLGQLYNGESRRTLIVFAWESYYVGRILRDGLEADHYRRLAAALPEGGVWRGMDYAQLRERFHFHDDRQRDYVWYAGALLIASVLDAYVFANLHDFDTGDIRAPRKLACLPIIDPSRGRCGLSLVGGF